MKCKSWSARSVTTDCGQLLAWRTPSGIALLSQGSSTARTCYCPATRLSTCEYRSLLDCHRRRLTIGSVRYTGIRRMVAFTVACCGVSESVSKTSTSLTIVQCLISEADTPDTGSLAEHDHSTKTRMGRRLMREWIGRPLLDVV
jgi:hypothetical protein